MKIEVQNISKKFGRQSILKDFSYSFLPHQKYVITGANGSGKSTLLKIVSGYLSPDSGSVSFTYKDTAIDKEEINRYISFAAPYIQLPEDLTVSEIIAFQSSFKALTVSNAEFAERLKLSAGKKTSELSSGMKQRLLLGLAFFTDSPLLLLDEPTSFFDKEWKNVYQNWISQQPADRTIILSSNEEEEYSLFNQRIELTVK